VFVRLLLPVLVYFLVFFSATSACGVRCLLLGQQTQIAGCVAVFWQQLIGIKIYNTGIINGLLICHKISYLAAKRRVQLRICLCTRALLPRWHKSKCLSRTTDSNSRHQGTKLARLQRCICQLSAELYPNCPW